MTPAAVVAPPAPDVEFTGQWADVPLEVRRFLTQRLLDRALEIHDGPVGLIKWLYAGVEHDGLPLSRTYAMSARDFWPYILVDARRWTVARVAAQEAAQGAAHEAAHEAAQEATHG